MGLPRLAGEVSGRIEAEGQNLSLRELKARAMVRAFDIDQAHRNILSARDFGLSLDQGRLNLPPTRFNLAEEGRMDLSASGEVPESLKLTATGDIPATVLGAFGEAFEDGSGRLMFTARSELVRGKPRLTAEILIKDLGATLTYNGQRLQAVNGRAVIDGNLASLSELSGRLDGGSFTATGTMALDGLKPRNLALKAQTKALPVELPETMDLKLDSRLSLTADEQRARLDGLVAVTEGTYYKDLKADLLSNMLGSLVKPAATKPRPTMDDYPWLGRTSLDIDLVRRGSLKVENNLAELELNPDLKLGGTLANPVVSGRVSVTGGSVTYQGREFTVKRGNVDFLNPNHTEARVDIQSQTVVGEYAIELDVEGPLDALVLSLSSEPAASQSDILSLLLLGKTSAQLADSDESVGLSPAGMLAELLSSTYADEIKATTSLDVFKLESDSFASSGTGNLKLTMGKELSRRLSLRYELETRDNVSSQRGIAEYKLLDTLYLNGYQGSSGTFGADLQYRYEFR
ncbi:MAG: hypothetical protein BWY87_00970 [Deltaproteobacteria bacterium ADurb.Bin510]|nr:MAG: hypothetical protein BWY87_00970 [Deltaproteobacteria bacterium ADurb.Bin510]